MTQLTTLIRRSVGVALGAATLLTVATLPASAQVDPPDPKDAPQLDLLVTDGAGNALDGGGSDTVFEMELEGEDECPGDSANDQYRIDSYMIPIDDDPADVVFTGQGPTPLAFKEYGSFRMPLYKISTAPYAAELTAKQLVPGGPGPIPELPGFGFGAYIATPGLEDYEGGLPSGDYRVGLACTYAGRITNYWETTIAISQDAADEPVGIAWTVTGPQPRDLESATPGSSRPLVVGLLALAAVLAAVAVLLHRSSSRRPDPTVADEAVV
ncbi:MAG: hypothetical protein ACSLFP_06975 [Acidimicrobiales bacterium]